jgi:hypothetical protein
LRSKNAYDDKNEAIISTEERMTHNVGYGSNLLSNQEIKANNISISAHTITIVFMIGVQNRATMEAKTYKKHAVNNGLLKNMFIYITPFRLYFVFSQQKIKILLKDLTSSEKIYIIDKSLI